MSVFDHSVPALWRQQVNAPHHKPEVMSNWFLEHNNALIVLQSHHILWYVEREGHIMEVQQRCDTIMPIRTKNLDLNQRIRSVVTFKLECWSTRIASVCFPRAISYFGVDDGDAVLRNTMVLP